MHPEKSQSPMGTFEKAREGSKRMGIDLAGMETGDFSVDLGANKSPCILPGFYSQSQVIPINITNTCISAFILL